MTVDPKGEIKKVVVRFADGRVLKGTTQDFYPGKPQFHLLPVDGGASQTIRFSQLKAVFLVRDFVGNSERTDVRGFLNEPVENMQGQKIAVLFKDGELVCGYSLGYSVGRDGFFVFPADTGGNNLRMYVISAACKQVKAGAGADMLVQKVLDARSAA